MATAKLVRKRPVRCRCGSLIEYVEVATRQGEITRGWLHTADLSVLCPGYDTSRDDNAVATPIVGGWD